LKENFDRFTHDNFKEKEMADFRKMLFVLAGLLILIGTASAQTGVTCTAFVANQPTLRQEGTTEPAGDILISCSGTLVGAQTGSQTLTLFVNGAPVTSRQLYTGSAPSSNIPTEAALLVNDCTTTSGTSVTGATCNANTNPTQGLLQTTGGSTVTFTGFLLPTNGQPFQIRVTNVRVNANSLAAGSFVTGTVLASFGIQNQQNLVLGAVQGSLSVTIASPPGVTSFAQCNSTPTAGTVVSSLTIKELVNTAFKAPNVILGALGGIDNNTPGQWYQNGLNTESQTVLSPIPSSFSDALGAIPGQADAATRIRVNFSNIPAGVTLQLPVTVNTGTTAVMQITNSGDVGTFSIAGAAVTLTAPAGAVTYQIITASTAATQTFTVPVTITYAYAPPSTPNVGTILASATYAPTAAEVTATTGQIPRFADTSVLTPIIAIAACQTDLLFTYMVNQAGFDTGYTIANTSADPFGTAAQNGTCTLNWYGTGPAAGTATTTASIAAGSYRPSLVSIDAPGFAGYMIAVCNFQYGHGAAFISDGFGQPSNGRTQGYLASIIPTPGVQNSNGGTANVRNASDSSLTAKPGAGEGLNQ